MPLVGFAGCQPVAWAGKGGFSYLLHKPESREGESYRTPGEPIGDRPAGALTAARPPAVGVPAC